MDQLENQIAPLNAFQEKYLEYMITSCRHKKGRRGTIQAISDQRLEQLNNHLAADTYLRLTPLKVPQLTAVGVCSAVSFDLTRLLLPLLTNNDLETEAKHLVQRVNHLLYAPRSKLLRRRYRTQQALINTLEGHAGNEADKIKAVALLYGLKVTSSSEAYDIAGPSINVNKLANGLHLFRINHRISLPEGGVIDEGHSMLLIRIITSFFFFDLNLGFYKCVEAEKMGVMLGELLMIYKSGPGMGDACRYQCHALAQELSEGFPFKCLSSIETPPTVRCFERFIPVGEGVHLLATLRTSSHKLSSPYIIIMPGSGGRPHLPALERMASALSGHGHGFGVLSFAPLPESERDKEWSEPNLPRLAKDPVYFKTLVTRVRKVVDWLIEEYKVTQVGFFPSSSAAALVLEVANELQNKEGKKCAVVSWAGRIDLIAKDILKQYSVPTLLVCGSEDIAVRKQTEGAFNTFRGNHSGNEQRMIEQAAHTLFRRHQKKVMPLAISFYRKHLLG